MMNKIAAQLYTVSDHTTNQSDLHATVHKVAGIGFEHVQFSAVAAVEGPDADTTPAVARAMLDDHGLSAIGAHRRFGGLRDDTQAEIDFLLTLGCQMVSTPIIFDEYDYRDFDGYRRYLQDSQAVREKLSAAGLDLCYHNHSHEFVYFAGTNGMDYLIANSDLFIELDVYWAAVTGADPAAIIERLGKRARYLHCKDAQVFPPEDPGGRPGPIWAPVGEGLLNWETILAAAKTAGTEFYIIEQDQCRRDPFDCLASSRQFLVERLGC